MEEPLPKLIAENEVDEEIGGRVNNQQQVAYRSNHVDLKKRAIVEEQEVKNEVNHLQGPTYNKDEGDDCEEGGGLFSIAVTLGLA